MTTPIMIRISTALLIVWPLSALGAQGVSGCAGPAQDLARPLTGTWHEFTVTDSVEVLEGTLTSTLEAGGCAFIQRFMSRDSSFTFVSVGHVDPATGMWRETFVFSSGTTRTWRWEADGPDLLVICASCPPDTIRRLRIRNITDSEYDVLEESSTDGGATWVPGELTRTRRVGGA